MDTTIISVLATGAGTVIAVVGLVSRSIGNLRSHMDQRIDVLTHANQQAHDAIGLRIDTQGSELRARIDAQRTDLCARIDAQGAELGARIDAQGAELGARITAQGTELGARIDAQGAELGARIDAQGAELRKELGGRLERVEVGLARVSEDVAFIKGRMTAQPDD